MTAVLAHTATGGGSFDQIALALGLVLLGLAFLVQRTVDKRVSILLVVLGVVGLVGSQTFLKDLGGGSTITVQGQEFEEEELKGAVTALCTARTEAASGDIDAAQLAFADRAHVPLHVIVVAVEDEDRDLAGRMLEAKQAVEQFALKKGPDELVDRLEDLLEVTVESLRAMNIPASTC